MSRSFKKNNVIRENHYYNLDKRNLRKYLRNALKSLSFEDTPRNITFGYLMRLWHFKDYNPCE